MEKWVSKTKKEKRDYILSPKMGYVSTTQEEKGSDGQATPPSRKTGGVSDTCWLKKLFNNSENRGVPKSSDSPLQPWSTAEYYIASPFFAAPSNPTLSNNNNDNVGRRRRHLYFALAFIWDWHAHACGPYFYFYYIATTTGATWNRTCFHFQLLRRCGACVYLVQ